MPMDEVNYQKLLDVEGRVREKVPGDAGGETILGEDRADNAASPVWALADADDVAGKDPAKDPVVLARIRADYERLWDANGLDRLPAVLRGPVFGGIVNQGPGRIWTWLQQSANEIFCQEITKTDGIPGPATITALARVSTDALADKFKLKRVASYTAVALKRHAAATTDEGRLEAIKFYLGLMDRVMNGGM